MILRVENGIREISAVVQDNSVAAQKSAVVSKGLSQQARTLNRLISNFRIDEGENTVKAYRTVDSKDDGGKEW